MAVRWIFCLHYINGRIGDEETKGVELIGYDTPRQAYFTPFFDNQGSAGFEELRADENTWTDLAGKKCSGRCLSPVRGRFE
jgi:hypothetical protein